MVLTDEHRPEGFQDRRRAATDDGGGEQRAVCVRVPDGRDDAGLDQRDLDLVLGRSFGDVAGSGSHQHQPAQPAGEVGMVEKELDGQKTAHGMADEYCVIQVVVLDDRCVVARHLGRSDTVAADAGPSVTALVEGDDPTSLTNQPFRQDTEFGAGQTVAVCKEHRCSGTGGGGMHAGAVLADNDRFGPGGRMEEFFELIGIRSLSQLSGAQRSGKMNGAGQSAGAEDEFGGFHTAILAHRAQGGTSGSGGFAVWRFRGWRRPGLARQGLAASGCGGLRVWGLRIDASGSEGSGLALSGLALHGSAVQRWRLPGSGGLRFWRAPGLALLGLALQGLALQGLAGSRLAASGCGGFRVWGAPGWRLPGLAASGSAVQRWRLRGLAGSGSGGFRIDASPSEGSGLAVSGLAVLGLALYGSAVQGWHSQCPQAPPG